jgi:hypothetical protein
MKDLLTRIIYKIQQIAMTKLFELFLYIVVAGAIVSFTMNYLAIQHMNSIFSDIFVFLFVYYAGYKILLE